MFQSAFFVSWCESIQLASHTGSQSVVHYVIRYFPNDYRSFSLIFGELREFPPSEPEQFLVVVNWERADPFCAILWR